MEKFGYSVKFSFSFEFDGKMRSAERTVVVSLPGTLEGLDSAMRTAKDEALQDAATQFNPKQIKNMQLVVAAVQLVGPMVETTNIVKP